MNLYDNSVLADFKRCPRLYYFRHIRGWSRPGFNAALSWGSAWHSAMDVIWTAGTHQTANEAFLSTWDSLGGLVAERAQPASKMKAHTHQNAFSMLCRYHGKYASFLDKVSDVLPERSFRVDIGIPGVRYTGRIDKTFSMKGKHVILDHKTTGMGTSAGNFYEAWLESFDLSSQLNGYMYACGDPEATIMVDAALVHPKTVSTFQMLSYSHTEKAGKRILATWHTEIQYWIGLVEMNRGLIADCKEHEVMPGFPRSGECLRYGRLCTYFELCNATQNPETIETPPGFNVSFWDPTGERT